MPPYFERRHFLTPYCLLGSALKGVYLRNSRCLQIDHLQGWKPGAGRARENLFDHIVEMSDLINSNLRLQKLLLQDTNR